MHYVLPYNCLLLSNTVDHIIAELVSGTCIAKAICCRKLDLALNRLSNVQSVYVHSPRAAPVLLHNFL